MLLVLPLLRSVVAYFCSDDKHSDRHSERHRPVCLFLHADSRSCRGGRHSYVTCQHLPPVRLSHLDHAHPGLGVCKHVNLRNSHHCTGTLHRRHLSNVVQCKNELLGVFNPSGPSFLYLPSCCQAWLQPRPIDLSLVWHTPWRLRSLHVLASRQVFFILSCVITRDGRRAGRALVLVRRRPNIYGADAAELQNCTTKEIIIIIIIINFIRS